MSSSRILLSSLGLALVVGSLLWLANTVATTPPQAATESVPDNVLGQQLDTCCTDPVTGYYRTGLCQTGPSDAGTHVVCAVMDAEFLAFTKSKGNDLSTPRPKYQFPGLKPGDKWCLCALRWREAEQAGKAPKVILESTHQKALEYIDREVLEAHAKD